jgi:hypothetical protein
LQRTLEREAKRLAELTKDEDKHDTSKSALNKPQDEWEDHIHFAGLSSEGPSNENLPENLQDAYSRPDGDKWRAAMHEELENLRTNHVYEEVPIPKGAKPITSKAAFRIKFDRNGNITRYKIRIMARGFVQREGIDYNEVFAPVASIESVRIIIALAAKYNLELDQMDVTGAYLNGKLDEEIYLTPPEGTNIKPGYCWRLRQSLYGLKQAGCTWNKTLDLKLRELGFNRLNAESCLHTYRGKEGLCFLVVYVDDLLLATASRTQMDKIKSMLTSTYKMHDLGPAKYILGMRIQWNHKEHTIALSQQQYANTVLERFGMSDCKPVFTPMETKIHPSADDPVDNEVVRTMKIGDREVTYHSIVGSLMWLTLGTQPDLAYTTGVIGRYSANPKACHWAMAKRALRYLKATKDTVLVFNGSDVNIDMQFHRYSDANWNSDHDTSRSTSGYVFISNRGAIAWSSKMQSMVSLSSTESEYIG